MILIYTLGDIYDDDYTDYEYEEDICMTTEDSDDPKKECVFPFTHDNVTYFGCPFDSIDETKRWCSTKTDENGVHVRGEGAWGYCTSGCKLAEGTLNFRTNILDTANSIP